MSPHCPGVGTERILVRGGQISHSSQVESKKVQQLLQRVWLCGCLGQAQPGADYQSQIKHASQISRIISVQIQMISIVIYLCSFKHKLIISYELTHDNILT